jgi:hypothetical protein
LFTLDYFYDDGKRYSAIRIAVHRLFIQSTSNVTWHYSFSYVSKVLTIFITIFWQQLSGQLKKMSPSASHKKCKSEWRRRALDKRYSVRSCEYLVFYIVYVYQWT